MATNSDLERVFQSCLELIEVKGESVASVLARYPEYAEVLRPELEAAYWVQRQVVLFGARPGFVRVSSQRLVNQIRQEAAGVNGRASALRTSPGWLGFLRQRRAVWQFAFVLILVASLFLGSSGIALASQGSLPGDRLYPVKVTLEKAGLAVTPSAAGDTYLHTLYAQRRLVEIQSLVLEGRFEYISEAVASFESHITQAVTGLDQVAQRDSAEAETLAASLSEMLSGQTTMMAVLAEVSPPEIRYEFDRAQSATQQGLIAAEGVLANGPSGPEQITPPPVSNTRSVPTLPPASLPAGPLPTVTPTPTQPGQATATATSVIQPGLNNRPTATSTATSAEPLRMRKTDTPTPTPTNTLQPGRSRMTNTPRPTNTHRPTRQVKPTKELRSDDKPAKPPRPPVPPRP